MARPPPAGAVSASWRPIILSGLWRSRQRKGRAFSYMRDLISVLYTVAPQVLDEPHFLERCVLLDGVPASVSPRDLIESILGVETAVLVRDSQTGFRIGLVVFFDALDSAAATNQTPRKGLYATCTPATWRGEEVSRTDILDGVADESARRCTARLLRSLLPPHYILADEDREFHLRCILIGDGRATINEGAHGLCDLAWKVLFARGYVVTAAIVHRDGRAGVLVYDDTESTELVARRAPQLYTTGLQLYDSSLFPLLADSADRDATLLRRLLPRCVTSDEQSYRRRVLMLTGLELDSQKLDAANLANFLRLEADLFHPVEAVIIHRTEGLVVVVLGSSEDTVSLLGIPEETWVRFFGQKPNAASVFGFAGDICSELPSAMVGETYWTDTEAVERLKDWIEDMLQELSDDDTIGIVHCLIRHSTVVSPDSVLRGGFPERSLLLSDVVQGTTSFDLKLSLSADGELYNVSLDSQVWKALAVFRCWHGAARLLRETQNTWASLGFLDCSRVPDAEHAGAIAQEVVDELTAED